MFAIHIVSRLPNLIDCMIHNNLFSAQETLTVYAKDQPMFNQLQKYSDLSDNTEGNSQR